MHVLRVVRGRKTTEAPGRPKVMLALELIDQLSHNKCCLIIPSHNLGKCERLASSMQSPIQK
jgi:hypothetical protein